MENTLQAKRFVSFYTRGEEIFNAVSHIVGGGLGVVFWAVLLALAYPSAAAMAAVSVFCASVVTLYTMSALYHFLPDGRAKGVFRVFDHCTIFLLIAGTYTPFCLLAVGGRASVLLLAFEWTCAVAGIALNAAAMRKMTVKVLSMILYFSMGWAAVAVVPFVSVPPASFALVLAGGIAYTVGIVFFALGKKVRYFHSVWHLFDLLGTTLQFFSVLLLL